MANKITQLVNESGDNLYPLAGGMAADSINTQMLKDGAVTSDKIDWATIQNIDITSYFTVQVQTPVTRAFITTFGKIGFVDIAFAPINNVNGTVIQLPESLGIKPIYSTELTARIGDADTRRGIIATSGTNTLISVNQHTSSANKFVTIFGMFFLQ